MKATNLLHNEGQSLWLDNITRDLLESGTLKRYVDELSVTGLTSNPTIFDHAIKNSAAYDSAITTKLKKGTSAEALFFDLALEDLTRAADLFRPIHERTRFRAPGKAFRRLRRRHLLGFPSTSLFCSPANIIWQRPRRSCAALNGASMRALIPL